MLDLPKVSSQSTELTSSPRCFFKMDRSTGSHFESRDCDTGSLLAAVKLRDSDMVRVRLRTGSDVLCFGAW